MNLQTRKQKETVIAFAILSLVVIAYGYQCTWNKVCGMKVVERVVRNGKEIVLPHGTIYAEVADTPQSRAQGLSGRTGLKEDEGMLFVFDQPGKYGFWMKDMLFPIDMVWISADGTVVYVEQNISPDTYFNSEPPQTFVNEASAKYVLELSANQAEKYGLYLGAKVRIGE